MEIRMQEVILVGRMVKDPIIRDDATYFTFEADETQLPFQCFCDGKTAENLQRYLRAGDEFSIEGKLEWRQFEGEASPRMLIKARFISYGRKAQTFPMG